MERDGDTGRCSARPAFRSRFFRNPQTQTPAQFRDMHPAADIQVTETSKIGAVGVCPTPGAQRRRFDRFCKYLKTRLKPLKPALTRQKHPSPPMKHRTPTMNHDIQCRSRRRTSNVPDFHLLGVQCSILDVRCFRNEPGRSRCVALCRVILNYARALPDTFHLRDGFARFSRIWFHTVAPGCGLLRLVAAIKKNHLLAGPPRTARA